MDAIELIRDEDLRTQLARVSPGPGYQTLVEMLVKTQHERDAEAQLGAIARRRLRVRNELKQDCFEHDDRHHIHSVLALCGLPYREPGDAREYVREYGKNSLAVQAGFLKDPETGRMVQQGLPYGPKARLLLLHICTMAVRQKSPEIAIADSMSAFIRDLGFAVTGGKRGTIVQFKEQLNRLAAARMQIGLWHGSRTTTINAQPIRSLDIWLPTDPGQRVLWSSSLKLDKEFYESLREHALPVDIRLLRAFSQSAKQIDIVLWLGYRLQNVKRRYTISWEALQEQFGTNVKETWKFKQGFVEDLRAILEVIPHLPLILAEEGVTLLPNDGRALLEKEVRKLPT
ncbi:MAG: replication protein RepA [Hyphomicrobiales bacterium]|nr:replication protein RepA [Hyphomicrobiales bacterium]